MRERWCDLTDTTKDERFLKSAIALSKIWSKDVSTKVCALAVGDTPNLVAFGYNGFPPGIEDTPDRLGDRPTKYSLTLHAEVNALHNATFPIRTLYVTHCPCQNCALHIIAQRTIRRVVFAMTDDVGFDSRWRESSGAAVDLFSEAGIQIVGITV